MTLQRPSYLPELDGVRAMSILLVLAAHLLPLGPKVLILNATAGKMGMALFFCLSGFLITRFLYANDDLRVFLVRRMARILPLLVVYALILGLIIHRNLEAFSAAILFYLNYTDSIPEGMSHLWSLCVEVHFYVAIGITIACLGRRGFWLVPVAALVVFYLRVEHGAYSNIRTHLRVDEILSGSLLALLWLNQGHLVSRKIIPLLSKGFLPLSVLFFLSSHDMSGPLNYLRPYTAAGLVGAILFMPDGAVRRIMRTRSLAYIATISYALYVWHPLMAMGWLGEGGTIERYLIKRPITFALTFLAAHLSTHTFERYFIRRAREWTALPLRKHGNSAAL